MKAALLIVKNTAVLYAAHIIAALLTLVLTILIARKLGDVSFGRYSFALAFTSLFAVIPAGLNSLIVRDVARDKSVATKYLGNIVIMKAIMSVMIIALIALIIILMDYPLATTTAVLIFGVYTVFIIFADTFKMVFLAFERMEHQAIIIVVRQFVIVSLSVSAIFMGYGFTMIACVFVIGSVVDLVLSFFICDRRFTRLKLEIDIDFWKKAIKIALPLTFLPLAAIIYTRIDILMLSAMKGDAVVGWYNAAYNLILALQPIPNIFAIAVFPLAAQLFVSSRDSLKVAYEKSAKYLLILGLPIAVGASVSADRIITVFYGTGFTNSVLALQILSWEVLLFFIYRILANILISMDRQNQMAIVAGSCAVCNVIFNAILIPSFSYIGAAVATIITETILLGAYFYLVSKYLYLLPLHKVIVKPAIACLVMAVFVHFCTWSNLAVVIISAAVLYFAVFFVIKGFSSEDINLMKAALRLIGSGKWRRLNTFDSDTGDE